MFVKLFIAKKDVKKYGILVSQILWTGDRSKGNPIGSRGMDVRSSVFILSFVVIPTKVGAKVVGFVGILHACCVRVQFWQGIPP